MESYQIFIMTAVFNLGAFIGVAKYLVTRLATKDEVKLMIAHLEKDQTEKLHEVENRVTRLEA